MVWDPVPSEPVSVTLYLPSGVEAPAVKLSRVVPGVDGLTETLDLERVPVMPAGPFGGEKFTVPEKPLTLDTVIVVELVWEPWTMTANHQFGVMAKFDPGGGSTMNVPCMVAGSLRRSKCTSQAQHSPA